MKVVLGGPPHSGKSCLRFGLKEAIKAIPKSPYPYVITACPDGEGSWFQETVHQDQHLAKNLKTNYKGKFTDKRTEVMTRWIENCSEPLTLIDIGGIPDDKNELICSPATHAILISSVRNDLLEWRNFCSNLDLHIIAEIHSDYNGVEDGKLVLENDGVYRGSVHHLERGDLTVQHRPTVVELANILFRMVT